MASQESQDLNSLKQNIKELIVDVANLPDTDPADIGDTTNLYKDGLGLDSIDLLELVVTLEKKYGIKVRNDDRGREILRDVNGIANAIFQLEGAKL